jgi:hypothetical protein
MDDTSAKINADINRMANQLRALRVAGADFAKVKALEEKLRLRWGDLRAYRAGGAAPADSASQGERKYTRWSS